MTTGPGRGLAQPEVEGLSIAELSSWAPRLPEVLKRFGVPLGDRDASLAYVCAEAGIQVADVLAALEESTPTALARPAVARLDVVAGTDKDGNPEPIDRLTIRSGQSVAIVGDTGSGKSCLLADVESLACGDSPTGRVILLDEQPPPDDLRWSPALRPVAQVSQSMGFMLDITVGEFVEMHAASQGLSDTDELRVEVVDAACSVCGEPFAATTPLCTLSGGQTRALMIADAALVGRAPVVVIDEIENAGIDRNRALEFLARQRTLTLLATHDPLLALTADLRVILKNGSMQAVLPRSEAEAEVLSWLEHHEQNMVALRRALRRGERLRTLEGLR